MKILFFTHKKCSFTLLCSIADICSTIFFNCLTLLKICIVLITILHHLLSGNVGKDITKNPVGKPFVLVMEEN